jgi:hypothetical protein
MEGYYKIMSMGDGKSIQINVITIAITFIQFASFPTINS